MVRFITCNVYHMRQFCRLLLLLSMIWYCRIQFARRVQTTRFSMMRFSLDDSAVNWLCWNSSIDGASRLLHADIAYEFDTAEIITSFFRISYWLHDLMRMNSIACHVSTTKCTMMRFTPADSDINWQYLQCLYWQGCLDLMILMLHMK